MHPSKLKFAIIGAGSACFCPATVADILLSENINSVPLTIALMDIDEAALDVSAGFARQAIAFTGSKARLQATTDLAAALDGADFVVTAIEVDRYRYWSMDFHIPRRYGFRQIYGENGGPGGMFHALRNLPPMLRIARAMERICPDAWLLNYTNPEAKLVAGIAALTKVKCVGLCHGEAIGRDQLAMLLGLPQDELVTEVAGMNHFGWFTKIARKGTGEDLYPELKRREREMDWLSHWDELALTRLMLRTYGLYAYPGANHIGEYVAWSDQLLASMQLQYFYDPAACDPWSGGPVPQFVYSLAEHPTDRPLFPGDNSHEVGDPGFRQRFTFQDGKLAASREYGIPIAEAIAFDIRRPIGAVNMPNEDYVPGLPRGMVLEMPAIVDGSGVHPQKTGPLPPAITAMIQTQGAVIQLLIEAYRDQSRNKLLQAMLLDPTVSNYESAVALIDEMFQRQKEILPVMHWQ